MFVLVLTRGKYLVQKIREMIDISCVPLAKNKFSLKYLYISTYFLCCQGISENKYGDGTRYGNTKTKQDTRKMLRQNICEPIFL